MKKKMMMVCMMVIGLLPIASKAAKFPDSFPQLASREEFITWACRHVGGGIAYVSGTFVSSTNSQTYVEVTTNVTDPRIVLKALASETLGFEPVATNDWVSSVIMIRDAYFHTLFYGVNSIKLTKTSTGDWSLPANANQIKVNQLNYWQSVYVGPDVYGAQLIIRNKSGDIIGYEWYEAYNGWLNYYPTSRFGAGHLILYGYDNTSQPYDLRNGGQKVTTSLVSLLGLSGDMSSLITYVPDDTVEIKVNPFSQNGYGEVNPVELKLTATRTVNFSGLTTEGEPAIEVIVTEMETGEEIRKPIAEGASVGISLKAGRYHVGMKWRDGFGTRQDYYGGDKG